MYRGQNVKGALNIFKWMRRGETSLTSGLLSNVPPEIELSDYQRFPSSGSESPSGLLNGEGLIVQPIADLDLFFGRIYSYYCEKGLWCIVIKWMVELLSLGFVICFSGFFLLFVDWNGLRNAKCGINAVESGTKPCDLAKEALHLHPFTPLTTSKCIIIGYLGLFSVYWIFCFLRFFVQLKDTLEIRRFYSDSLHITDTEVQTMQWASVLEKVVQVQRSQQLCVVKDLSAHDVIMRIMRKENYLIGMLNKGVLAFPISRWVPGTGPAVNSRKNGMKNRLVLNKTLQWTLEWCILQSMFDRNFFVKGSFISNPSSLKMRLTAVGVGMLLLSPFIGIFMLVFLFLRHAEQFYNHPSTASSRRLSTLSKWMFREFNEVDHLFKHRINSSVPHACDYLKQFPSPIVTIIAKFISFVSGGFAAVLLIIAFLEESLLEGQIYGRNLLWYAAVFGTVTAISRALVADELQVLDPEGAMSLVVQHTHFMPKRWRSKENTDTVRTEFETLFQYTGMTLLEEMASIILTPYLLLHVVPKRVDDILQFISDFTVDVDGVGHVCSFSVFDFEKHGNNKYASPHNASRTERSSQGKLEKSFLSFQSTYPFWEPNVDGKKFISNLRNFHEQKLQARRSSQPRARPNFRDQGNYFTRDMVYDNNNMRTPPRSGYLLGSLWSIDQDQKNHPYLLDWYYTSWPSSAAAVSSSAREEEEVSATPEPVRHSWFNNNTDKIGERFEDDWGYPSGYPFEGRLQSQYGASSLNPNFRDSVIHHGELGHHPTESHWWVRTAPQDNSSSAAAPHGSFLEPPTFGHPSDPDNLDRISEEEQEQSLDRINSRRLSSSTAEPVRDLWMDNNTRQRDRSYHQSEASSSNPSFRDDDDNNTGHPNDNSHWRGRNDANFRVPQTSFMEPPGYGFRRNASIIHNDDSDRGSTEGFLERRNSEQPAGMSKTFYMGDSVAAEEFMLPFEDIHQNPLKIRVDKNADLMGGVEW